MESKSEERRDALPSGDDALGSLGRGRSRDHAEASSTRVRQNLGDESKLQQDMPPNVVERAPIAIKAGSGSYSLLKKRTGA